MSLPGSIHKLPAGAKCDCHPDRDAVVNVQGETDSFGYETVLMCRECREADRAYERSAEARSGKCDWCAKEAADLAWTRDYDEGMGGPVYRVCGSCRTRRDQRLEEELARYDAYCDDGGFDD